MWTALVVSVVAGSWAGVRWHRDHHAVLRFVAPDGARPEIELTFFPNQLAFTAPSPPPPLGQASLAGEEITVGEDLVPERSVVRYVCEGFGAGFARVQLGAVMPEIPLRAAASISGRVGEPVYYWCMGWRCTGFLPVVDAEVVVMGGGEHGVDLARTRTDEDGSFTVSGFDGELDVLGLRVIAAGFEVAHQRIFDLSEHPEQRALVNMSRAPARAGRLLVEPGAGVKPEDFLVPARGLPGVQARPDSDGEVVLDHIAPDVEARVLVYGLPPMLAQTEARTKRGGGFEVEVVRGAVVTGRVLGEDLEPRPNALVWIGERHAVRTDGDGIFVLENLTPGARTIKAQWRPKRRRSPPLFASRSLTLVAGERHERVELLLER